MAERQRDPRLDFFRGLGMFIILVAHVPNNGWAQSIPARFGFSDATEIFVFCSGMASAVAFGRVFDQHGWIQGSARILHRCWQVYWAHIACFLVILTLLLAIDRANGDAHYVGELGLGPFLVDTARATIGLLDLTYVPNYFDILPMYLVILAMVPLVMAVARFGPAAVAGLLLSVWTVAYLGWLDLPAEPWSDRTWFFNPFAWQLVFFAGFAWMRGWLPAPVVDRRLVLAAAIVVLATVPFAWHRGFFTVPELREWNAWLAPAIDKTHVGPLRFLHFLAVAYLAYVAVGPRGQRLKGAAVDFIRAVGQQSLAVFLTGMVLAQLLGVVLDQIGRGVPQEALVNLAGFAVLAGAAWVTAWFKAPPWKGAGRSGDPAAARPARRAGPMPALVGANGP